jgi:RHS repeat-associated protein
LKSSSAATAVPPQNNLAQIRERQLDIAKRAVRCAFTLTIHCDAYIVAYKTIHTFFALRNIHIFHRRGNMNRFLGISAMIAVLLALGDSASVFARSIANSAQAGSNSETAWIAGSQMSREGEMEQYRTAALSQQGVGAEDFVKMNNGFPGDEAFVGGINITNGNRHFQQVDYAAEGMAAKLSMVRAYNSNNHEMGMFGLGWTTPFEESLQILSPEEFALHRGDGGITYYRRENENDLVLFAVMPKGDHSKIMIGEGACRLVLKNGEQHIFHVSGKLWMFVDKNGNSTELFYDTNGRLEKIQDATGRILSFYYNDWGMIRLIKDGVHETVIVPPGYYPEILGDVAAYEYDSETHTLLKSVAYSGTNSRFQFEYNTQGLLTKIRNANGHLVEAHDYDGLGRAFTSRKSGGIEQYTIYYISDEETIVIDHLLRVTRSTIVKTFGRNVVWRTVGPYSTAPKGAVYRNYDSDRNLIETIDQLGRATWYAYYPNGNVFAVSRPTWLEPDITYRTTWYDYDSCDQTQIREETDEMGGVINAYDENGNILIHMAGSSGWNNPSLTPPATTAYHYRPSAPWGLVEWIEEAPELNRNPIHFEYDQFGNMIKMTDAIGNQTLYGYDIRGRKTSITDWFGNETFFAYDQKNRLIRTYYPDDYPHSTWEEYIYNAADQLDEFIDAMGNSTKYRHDDLHGGRLQSVEDAAHHTTRYEYDSMSNVTMVIDWQGRFTITGYNDMGQVRKITYPFVPDLGIRVKHYEYDDAGQITRECYEKPGQPTWDCNGADYITTYVSDAGGRVIYKTDPLGVPTAMSYDAHDNMTGLWDAEGNFHGFLYDYTNRLQFINRNNFAKTMQFWYDAAGNMEYRRDYNSINNGARTKYEYDQINRLRKITYPDGQTAAYDYHPFEPYVWATNANGTVLIHYDQRNRIDGIMDVWGQTISSVNDGNGNRAWRNIGGRITAYQYNNINLMEHMVDSVGNRADFQYDGDGKILAKRLNNLVTAKYEYDRLDQLRLIAYAAGSSALGGMAFQPSLMGQIMAISDGAGQHGYDYDKDFRLTSATHSNPYLPSESYQYDAIGNIVNSSQPYPPLENAMYEYDLNGNRISKTVGGAVWRYEYDYENRLTKVMPPEGQSIEYKYDALGRRISRSYGEQWTHYTYDGDDVVLDQNSDGSWIEYGNGPGIDNKLWMQTRMGVGTWSAMPSSTPADPLIRQWGLGIEIPVPKDYDGDGKAEIAIYSPSDGFWHIHFSWGGSFDFQWGGPMFQPVPGDYDGDGYDDIAVYNRSDGSWHIFPSSTCRPFIIGWGGPMFQPVPADYDGDGKVDIAVYSPSDGYWYIRLSSTGTLSAIQLGGPEFKPVPADYNGDGYTDVAVYNTTAGDWHILFSSGGGAIIQWGMPGFQPVPGDYDGDGRADIAVYDRFSGYWYILPSSTYVPFVIQWGSAAHIPTPADYDGDGKTDIAVRGSEPSATIANTVFFMTDHQNSTRALISDAGSIIAGSQMDYDSFGNPAGPGSIGTRYSYTGREWDPDAKLYFYRSRYYDPQARRFLSEDPIGLNGGINLYAYAGNNPINMTDPQGQEDPNIAYQAKLKDFMNGRISEMPAPPAPQPPANAMLITSISKNKTHFIGQDADGGYWKMEIETRVDICSGSKKDAGGEFCSYVDINSLKAMMHWDQKAYGPAFAIIDVGDPRARYLHGGSSSQKIRDPLAPYQFAPNQNWTCTHGCTRGQNQDVINLNLFMIAFDRFTKGSVPILYCRVK